MLAPNDDSTQQRKVQAAAYDGLDICKHFEKIGMSEQERVESHVEVLLSGQPFSKFIRQADLACCASSWSTQPAASAHPRIIFLSR